MRWRICSMIAARKREQAGQGNLHRRRDREIRVGDQLQRVERLSRAIRGPAGDDPAQLHLRQPGDLRQPAHGERERPPVARQRRYAVGVFGECVIAKDFVGEDRQAALGGQRIQTIQLGALQERSGGIVGIHHHDAASTRRDGLLQSVEIDVPDAVIAQRILADVDRLEPRQKFEQRIGRPGRQDLIARDSPEA